MRLQMQERIKCRGLQRLLQTALAGIGLLAGCSGGGVTLPSSPLPPVPAASNATAYVGPQAPGYWTLSVDDTQNVFSDQPLSGATTSGGFGLTNGVLDLGNLQGVSLGKAVAQPAGGALLRQLGEVLKLDVKAFAVPRAGWAEAFEQFGIPKGHTGPAEEMYESVNAGWMDLGIAGTEHVPGTTSARDVFAAAQNAVNA